VAIELVVQAEIKVFNSDNPKSLSSDDDRNSIIYSLFPYKLSFSYFFPEDVTTKVIE